MQEGLVVCKIPCAEEGVPVAARLRLLDELEALHEVASGLGVGLAVARADDDADFLHVRTGGFIEDDAQRGTLDAVPVDKGLKGEGALVPPGGGDDGFADFHGVCESGL